MNDTERLNWLEKQDCWSLISDDGGHWACVQEGTQTVPEKDGGDIWTSFVILKGEWKDTIREAIDSVANSENET